MGMSPTMALIPNDGEVLKASKIHMAALLCIFPIFSSGMTREHGCKTRVGTHIVQWGGCKIYIVSVFAMD